MSTTTKTKRSGEVSLTKKELGRLFIASAQLTDLLEDFLEDRVAYGEEFLRGLKKSFREAREGRLSRLGSLADLRS